MESRYGINFFNEKEENIKTMNSSKMFEKASRQKLRWSVKGIGGEFTVEDLWSLEKGQLNSTAQALDTLLAAESQKTDYLSSDVSHRSVNSDVKIKRDIIVYIIKTRLAEEEALKQARIEVKRNSEERDKIIAALQGKAETELQKRSKSDLKARLAELEKEGNF